MVNQKYPKDEETIELLYGVLRRHFLFSKAFGAEDRSALSSADPENCAYCVERNQFLKSVFAHEAARRVVGDGDGRLAAERPPARPFRSSQSPSATASTRRRRRPASSLASR